MPGTWQVDETLLGEWISPAGQTYRISIDTSEPRREPEHGCPLKFHGQDGKEWAGIMKDDGSCEVQVDGNMQKGRLNSDGFLEWSSGQSWWKDHRSTPPYLYCARQKLRVYIFDRNAAVDELPYPNEVERHDGKPATVIKNPYGAWFRKNLQRVWCALRKCGAGVFGPQNTILLDTKPSEASHPQNVLVIPRFTKYEDSASMDKLREYLLGSSAAAGLVGTSPYCVPEYLQQHGYTDYPEFHGVVL